MGTVVLIDCDTLKYKNIEDLDEYKDRIDTIISEIIHKTNATHYKCFLETRGNQTFRKIKDASYKARRKRKELHNMREIQDYIMEAYDPFISAGVESDDSIISTWRCLKDNYPLTEVYIAGNDKDYLTYPIKYIDLYHGRYLQQENISQEDADYNFMFQMLSGDSADNISGVKGIGKVKAKKILDSCNGNKFSYIRTLLNLYRKQCKNNKLAERKLRLSYFMLRLKENVRCCKTFNDVVFS